VLVYLGHIVMERILKEWNGRIWTVFRMGRNVGLL